MTTKKTRADRADTNKLSSPGRPGVARREDRRLLWLASRHGVPAKTLPWKLLYLNLSDQGVFGRMAAWLPHICRLRPPALQGAI